MFPLTPLKIQGFALKHPRASADDPAPTAEHTTRAAIR